MSPAYMVRMVKSFQTVLIAQREALENARYGVDGWPKDGAFKPKSELGKQLADAYVATQHNIQALQQVIDMVSPTGGIKNGPPRSVL